VGVSVAEASDRADVRPVPAPSAAESLWRRLRRWGMRPRPTGT
jgi:hypothetical protein